MMFGVLNVLTMVISPTDQSNSLPAIATVPPVEFVVRGVTLCARTFIVVCHKSGINKIALFIKNIFLKVNNDEAIGNENFLAGT